MAKIVALRIFNVSISSTVENEIDHANASCLISMDNSDLRLEDNFLESFNHKMGRSGLKITAEAYTSPAKGPLHASSTPVII